MGYTLNLTTPTDPCAELLENSNESLHFLGLQHAVKFIQVSLMLKMTISNSHGVRNHQGDAILPVLCRQHSGLPAPSAEVACALQTLNPTIAVTSIVAESQKSNLCFQVPLD